VVYVVNKQIFGHGQNVVMHPDELIFFPDPFVSNGIRGSRIALDRPFEFAQAVVVLGADGSEFIL
jgi:hypothetical protein